MSQRLNKSPSASKDDRRKREKKWLEEVQAREREGPARVTPREYCDQEKGGGRVLEHATRKKGRSMTAKRGKGSSKSLVMPSRERTVGRPSGGEKVSFPGQRGGEGKSWPEGGG